MGTASGFLRNVKKPTAIGIRIKIIERQSIAKPALAGKVPELVTSFTVVLYGILPVAAIAPNMHINRPGHPQNRTVAMVAIIPVFLFIWLLL